MTALVDSTQPVLSLPKYDALVEWCPACAGTAGAICKGCKIAPGRGDHNQHAALATCFPPIAGMREEDQYPHMHSKWSGLNNDGRYLYVLAHALGCGDAGPTLADVCGPEARAFAEKYILDFRGKLKSR